MARPLLTPFPGRSTSAAGGASRRVRRSPSSIPRPRRRSPSFRARPMVTWSALSGPHATRSRPGRSRPLSSVARTSVRSRISSTSTGRSSRACSCKRWANRRAQAAGEVDFAVLILRYTAEWDRRIEGEILAGDTPGEVIHLLRAPVGVVVGDLPVELPAGRVLPQVRARPADRQHGRGEAERGGAANHDRGRPSDRRAPRPAARGAQPRHRRPARRVARSCAPS